MTAYVGFTSSIKLSGTPTAMTAEPCTSLTSTTYRVTSATKRHLDPSAAMIVYDGGVAIAFASVAVNCATGIITLSAPPAGAVTIDANYLPMLSMADVRGFEINIGGDLLDSTVMDTTTTSRARIQGLLDVSGTVEGLDNLRTDLDSGAGTVIPFTDFQAGTYKLLTIALGSSGAYFAAFVKFADIKLGATPEDLFKATLSWSLAGHPGVTTGSAANESQSWGFSTS